MNRRFVDRSKKIPLQAVLLIPYVLGTVSVVSITAYFAFRNGQMSVQSIAAESRQETVTRVIQYLDSYLETPTLINRINADAIRSGQVNLKDVSRLEHHLLVQLQQFHQINRILVGDETGMLRIANRYPQPTLLRSSPHHPRQVQVLPIDSDGYPTQTTKSLLQPAVQQQPWYRAAVEKKTLTHGAAVFQLADEPDLSLHTSQPIYDPKTGNLIGVFSAARDLSPLRQFLASLKLGKTGQLFILERNGLLISTSTNKQPYTTHRQNGRTELTRVAAVDSSDALIRSTSRYLLSRFGDFKHIQTPQQLEFFRDDAHLFVQVVPYRDSLGLDWLIAMVVPETDFMKEVDNHNRITLLWSIGALLGAIGLGFLTSAWVARPILRLSRASRAMAIGRWDQPVEENSQIAELEVLARSFNQMTEHLQVSFDQVKIALQESEEKFTKVFRTSPDAITIATIPEGRYLEVNDSFLAYNGYTREAVVGRTAWELNQVVDPTQAIEVRHQLQTQGAVRNLEFDYRTKTGQIRTGLLSADIIELEGQPRLLSIFKDITERKQAEAALKRSEARYLAILETQTDLIARHTPEGTLIFVNEAFCRYFGVTKEEVIGKPYQPNVFPADREQVAQLLSHINRDQPVITLENRVIAQGQVRWTRWTNQAFFDEQGQVIEFQSVGRDIDDLKQIEDELQQSEQRFRGVFDAAAIGMAVISPEGQFLEVNDALCNLLGYCEAELLALTVQQVTLAEDQNLDSQLIQQLLSGQLVSYQLEKRYIHQAGHTIWGLLSVSLVRDRAQIPLYFVIQIQNITLRKQIEANLQPNYLSIHFPA